MLRNRATTSICSEILDEVVEGFGINFKLDAVA
jgi:hypothetical protein